MLWQSSHTLNHHKFSFTWNKAIVCYFINIRQHYHSQSTSLLYDCSIHFYDLKVKYDCHYRWYWFEDCDHPNLITPIIQINQFAFISWYYCSNDTIFKVRVGLYELVYTFQNLLLYRLIKIFKFLYCEHHKTTIFIITINTLINFLSLLLMLIIVIREISIRGRPLTK